MSQRFKIRLVCFLFSFFIWQLMVCLDMPEKEATYIITNGGLNDPEKV